MSSYPTRDLSFSHFQFVNNVLTTLIYTIKIFIRCLLKTGTYISNNCYVSVKKRNTSVSVFAVKFVSQKMRKQMINTQISNSDLDCHYLRRCFFPHKHDKLSICLFLYITKILNLFTINRRYLQ